MLEMNDVDEELDIMVDEQTAGSDIATPGFHIGTATDEPRVGTDGDDLFSLRGQASAGQAALTRIDTLDGDDTLNLADGHFDITLGSGKKTLDLAEGRYQISAERHDAEVIINTMIDSELTFNGGDGHHSLIQATGGCITFNAGNGENMVTVQGGSGHQVKLGQGENNIVHLKDASGVSVTTEGGSAFITLEGGDGRVHTEGQAILTLRGSEESGGYWAQTGVGDDKILTSGGYSWINAGSGNDTISINTGRHIVFGAAGNDVINVLDAAGQFDGGEGNDNLILTTGGATGIGGEGNDHIEFTLNNNTAIGGSGADTFRALQNSSVAAQHGANMEGTLRDFNPAEGDRLDLSKWQWLSDPKQSQELSAAERLAKLQLEQGNGGDVLRLENPDGTWGFLRLEHSNLTENGRLSSHEALTRLIDQGHLVVGGQTASRSGLAMAGDGDMSNSAMPELDTSGTLLSSAIQLEQLLQA